MGGLAGRLVFALVSVLVHFVLVLFFPIPLDTPRCRSGPATTGQASLLTARRSEVLLKAWRC